MPETRFIQIHTLHSYPSSMLNADQNGNAKKISFGGTTRTRISSQCLKRHWRIAKDEFAVQNIHGITESVRSRNIVERMVIQPIRDQYSEEVIAAVEDAFNIGVYSKIGTTERGRQPLLMGLPEIEHLRQRAEAICVEFNDNPEGASEAAATLFTIKQGEGSNFRAMLESTYLPAGLESALFGRMITSDPYANIDAAVHVAHAFTVNSEEKELDYFTVVDDLQKDTEYTGSAHLGYSDLTTGIFYGYVVIDIPQLISNMEACKQADWQTADRTLASKVIEHLIHLIATVTPGAKVGSTAPYSYADMMLVEIGSHQPRSLANAYREDIQAHVGPAINALSEYMEKIDHVYGQREARRMMSVEASDSTTLAALAEWTGTAIRESMVE